MNLKLASRVNAVKYGLNAAICIAACAPFHWAGAQSSVQTPAASVVESNKTNNDARDASERAERERINQERRRVSAEHSAAKVDCYQKFRVNDCLSQARTTHNSQQADLKRQEISLNDLQRKRRGAEQLRKVEAKTSPERQEEIAQQRGKGLAAEATRQQRQSERAAPVAKATKGPKTVGKAPQASSSNAVEKQARQKSKAAESQDRIAAAARAKVQSEERQKDAAAHAASVQARQNKNKKPPAATLPMPLN
jgi:colicin import membrane protein